jgi:hypothetical protein
LEDVWYKFVAPKIQVQETDPLKPLPDLASAGAVPQPYGKDRSGKEVFAHPAWSYRESYDYERGRPVYKLEARYYQTEEEAHRVQEQTVQFHEELRAKEQRRLDREKWLVPAQERLEQVRTLLSSISRSYGAYGLIQESYDAMYDRLNEARRLMESQDADPRKVLETLEQIEKELNEGKVERARRAAMVPEVKADMEKMTVTIGVITYDNHASLGLTYDDYDGISRRWREAEELLLLERYGEPLMPNPDHARQLLGEIDRMIPEKRAITPEQAALASVLMGRDKGYAKFVRVSGGNVSEVAEALRKDEVSKNPSSIPIGGSGRQLVAMGPKLTFVYGSGNTGDSWTLAAGTYVISRDARQVFRVEEKPGAPFGLVALSEVAPDASASFSEQPTSAGPSEGRFNTGAFSGLKALKETMTKKPEPVPTASPQVLSVPAPEAAPKEKEPMTDILRAQLLEELAYVRLFLDTVRAVPEPDKKLPSASKISKERQRAADAKKELNQVTEEAKTSDDAPRLRGRVADLSRRCEKIAQEMARVKGEREDWPGRFRNLSTRLEKIAAAQEVAVDTALKEKIRDPLLKLAKKKTEPKDEDGELESILIDAL